MFLTDEAMDEFAQWQHDSAWELEPLEIPAEFDAEFEWSETDWQLTGHQFHTDYDTVEVYFPGGGIYTETVCLECNELER